MEDLGEQVGRKLACAVGSDFPSGTAPPADSTPQLDIAGSEGEAAAHTSQLTGHRSTEIVYGCFSAKP